MQLMHLFDQCQQFISLSDICRRGFDLKACVLGMTKQQIMNFG